MKIKSINLGIALGGWVIILIAAAVALPNPNLSSAIANTILVSLVLWFLLSVVALLAYFCRQWQRVRTVKNKAAFVVWMSVETAVVLVIVCGIVWLFVIPS